METEVVKSPKGRSMVVHKHNGRTISRQRAWQIAQIEAGLCQYCPNKAVVTGYCQRHLDIKRERQARWYQKRKLQKA